MKDEKIVLMVEDDVNLLRMNTEILNRNGYTVYGARSVAETKTLIDNTTKFDIAVLDVMLPDGDGYELATIIKNKIGCPVMMLTSKTAHEDIVFGMNSDADVYMTKPFVISELIARIEGLIKMRDKNVLPLIIKGDLKLDITTRQAVISGRNLFLTPKDFLLLLILVQSEDTVVKSAALYEKVWSQPLGDDTTALRSAITRLRKKLSNSEYTITSSRGEGYVFGKVL